jgi:glycyl-tRNA synthetase beta subunit
MHSRAASRAPPANAAAGQTRPCRGLADRFDTLVRFLAGLKPTGSQDPFALRRGANGAVRIASEMRGLRLDALAESASAGYSAVLGDEELRARWIDGRAQT